MQNQQESAQAAPNTVAFDPWIVWIAFRKHWGWVLPIGFLFASVGGLFVWYSFVPVYEATHIIKANNDYVLSQGIGNVSRDLARSERSLITNALVLDPVLSNPKLKTAPSLSNPLTAERQIRNHLSIGNAGTTDLLTISYRDTDRVMAAEVCNAIAESYLQVRRRLDDERMGNVEQWLAQPIEQWKRNVEALRTNLAELTKSTNGYDPFKQSNSLEQDASKMIQIRSELASLEAEETVLNARLKVLDARAKWAGDNAMPDPFEIERLVSNDRDVQKARQQLTDTETKIRQMEFREQENMWASRYQSLKDDAETLAKEVKAAEDAARVDAEKVVRSIASQSALASYEQQVQELQLKLVDVEAKRAAFKSSYEEEKRRLEKLGGETAEIFFAREDYEQAAEILSQLNNRQAILRTERGRGSSVGVMAAAKPPSWPIEEVPFKKIGMACSAAFLVPFALAILFEFRLKRLTNATSIESNNLAPILGEIARIPGGAKSSRGHRLFEESIDALRANLLFKLEGVRTIAVTSAMSSEGKSSVASQLAISLAKASETTVLLIDADLRSPDQHELFGLPNEPGLCKLLGGSASLEDCVDKSLGDLIHVLPAGRLNANPHNLLTKKNLENLFAQVESEYRFIVIDTAPVLPAAETLAAAAACSATLLCAMRDVSRSDHVKRTQRRLDACGANVIGTVFSGVPSREYAYRYGDYRYATDRIEAAHAE